MTILVKVKEHQLLNCIGYLSDNPSTFAQTNSCGIFHCSGIDNCAPRSCFALQVYGNRPPFNYLYLNRIFIERQGFKIGDQVILEPVKNVENCNLMEISPETYEDWNIIENTSCIIEEIFLQQIRVFQPGMSFVLHLSSGISANLRVAQLMPKIGDGSAALANNSTQVLVSPINNTKTAINTKHIKSQSSSIPNENTGFQDPISSFLSTNLTCKSRFLRVLPESLTKIEGFHLPIYTTVTISQDDIPYVKAELVQLEGAELSEPQFSTLILLPKSGNGLEGHWMQLFEILSTELPESCCISDDLRSLGLLCFTRFKCRVLKRKNVKKVKSIAYTASIEVSIEIVKKGIIEFYNNNPLLYSPCILTSNGQLLKLSYGDEAKNYHFVRLSSNDIQNKTDCCGYFWPDSLPDLQEDKSVLKMRTENETKKQQIENYAQRPVNAFDFQLELCIKFVDSLHIRLNTQSLPIGHLLITGHNYTGKSTLVQLIAVLLYKQLKIFACRIDCNDFKGKSPDAISHILESKLKALKIRSPSILLLDNLDFLNTQVEDEDRRRFISKVYSKIAQLITTSNIQVVASASSKNSLPTDLITFNGHQFFTDLLEIPPMKREDYVQVFNQLLSLTLDESPDLLRKLERLNLGETIKLCERLRLTHKGELTKDQILEAIDNLPSTNRSQTTQANSNDTHITFNDIGGYHEIKQKLKEVFLWPMQYPEIYESIGIRIGNGALLHGPSGCGKTLLSRGLATETGFNVIHVKGPELLSKYIGASEENVRKVFERARHLKPSLIIFDEIDSLVPKRGHDNTGVTDRVVNQFLTELDGVDSCMEGVYVLAATNRIDLIDTALLRPGRFDHKILVDRPSSAERLEILQIQCRDLQLESAEDLERVADETDNCSCAELRGIIVNASFESSRDIEDTEQPIISRKSIHNSLKALLEQKNQPLISQKVIKGQRVSLA